MKALQEKRDSFRSLLRRGLVILSILLLAFAFVACGNDSGSNNGPPTPPPNGNGPTPPPAQKVVAAMTIVRNPTAVSFEGQPADLTGLLVNVTYEDGTTEVISDVSQFRTEPALLTYKETTRSLADSPLEASRVTPLSGTASLELSSISVPLYHVSNYRVQRTAGLPLVRHLSRGYVEGGQGGGTPGGIQYGEAISITGRLTQQEYFEGFTDFDFDGVVVEGFYATFDARRFANLPAGLNVNHSRVRNPIPLTYLHVNENPAANMNGQPHYISPNRVGSPVINTNPMPGLTSNPNATGGMGINIRIPRGLNAAGTDLDAEPYLDVRLPITDYRRVMGLTVNTLNRGGFSDFFQFQFISRSADGVSEYWESELFGNAGLTLRAHYLGTTESKIIDRGKFLQARLTGNAGMTNPNLNARELDNVMATFQFFTGDFTTTSGGGTFPNQVVEVLIPVLEFERSVRLVRKANMPTEADAPIYWARDATTRTDQRRPPPLALIDAIRQVYDLVAVYEGDKTLTINQVMWTLITSGTSSTSPVLPNQAFTTAGSLDSTLFESANFTNPNYLRNEMEERELSFRFPPASGGSNHGQNEADGAVRSLTWLNFQNAAFADTVVKPDLVWNDPETARAFSGVRLEDNLVIWILPTTDPQFPFN